MIKDTPEAVYPDYPIHWEDCPEAVLGGLQRYVLKGIRTGGFLEAVLTNDLIARLKNFFHYSYFIQIIHVTS